MLLATAWGVTLGAFATHSSAGTYEVLYSFSYQGLPDDEGPVVASPVADGSGNIYGYTRYPFRCTPRDYKCTLGGLYRYSLLGRGYQEVYAFSAEGDQPVGSPVVDRGVVYGVLRSGGLEGKGAVFRYDPATGMRFVPFPVDTKTQTKNFSQLTGLTVMPSGDAYGLASAGIYRINSAFNRLDWVFEFASPVPSSESSMTQKDGLLFGSTQDFGFQFDPVTGEFMSWPSVGSALGLTFDGSGSLWGVFSTRISRFDDLSSEVRAHKFTNKTGATPPSGMVLAKTGLMYGVTRRGGDCESCGTIYRMNPVTSRYTVVHEFERDALENQPMGLTADADGVLYGHAAGGLLSGGVLFRFVP